MRRATRGAVAAAAIALSACVNGFQGANVQLDLSPGTPVQAGVFEPPMGMELPAATHFTLYAIQEQTLPDQTKQDNLFEVARFEVHHIVDITSPCFIDVGDHVPYPGLHVMQFANRIQQDTGITDPAHPPAGATQPQLEAVATAQARMAKIGAITTGPGALVAVTSASTTSYPPVAADCNGTSDQIPPPECIKDEENQRRLQLCQQTWKQDPRLWEGTDRVLTAPLNGTTFGLVTTQTQAGTPVGGAQLFVDNALVGVDAYAIYVQADMPPAGMDGPGTQLYFGRPTMPTRGVFHVHLVSPSNPALTAEMAVFTDLGQDDVQF